MYRLDFIMKILNFVLGRYEIQNYEGQIYVLRFIYICILLYNTFNLYDR